MKRPEGMAAENPCEHVPLDPVVLHLENLMALWTKNAIPQIPLENERLRAFLSQYQELWIK
jgi:hypothetical protein